jgi:hypothetical protein
VCAVIMHLVGDTLADRPLRGRLGTVGYRVGDRPGHCRPAVSIDGESGASPADGLIGNAVTNLWLFRQLSHNFFF